MKRGVCAVLLAAALGISSGTVSAGEPAQGLTLTLWIQPDGTCQVLHFYTDPNGVQNAERVYPCTSVKAALQIEQDFARHYVKHHPIRVGP